VTEENPALRFLAPQQRVEVAPGDADRLGIEQGDEVTVSQNGHSVRARVAIRERLNEGVCFLIEGTASDNANALVNGGPIAVEIEKVDT
jgi:anaerobic selenocysteine-containing dehydrogenase